MSDNYYSDINQLFSAAERKVKTILRYDIAPVAENILKQHIKSDIYDAYTPKAGAWVNGTTYNRRNVLGGSVYTKFISDDSILISSDAPASHSIVKGWSFKNGHTGAFLEMLENGDMGIWKSGFPRPAVSNAQKDISTSTKINAAMMAGIKREF